MNVPLTELQPHTKQAILDWDDDTHWLMSADAPMELLPAECERNVLGTSIVGECDFEVVTKPSEV